MHDANVNHNDSNGNYHKFSNDDKVNKTLNKSTNRKIFPAHQSWKEKKFNGDRHKDCNMADTFEPYELKNLPQSSKKLRGVEDGCIIPLTKPVDQKVTEVNTKKQSILSPEKKVVCFSSYQIPSCKTIGCIKLSQKTKQKSPASKITIALGVTGQVSWYNIHKGYGFIHCDNRPK